MSDYYCRLCGKPLTSRNRAKAHILTRSTWMAPLSKGTTEKLLGFSRHNTFDPTHNITDNTILCKPCDNSLALYEQEREELLKNITLAHFKSNTGAVNIKGYDAIKIKLAFLADIYRCSITTINPFTEINIGKKHEELIGKILRGEQKIEKPSMYSVILGKIKYPIAEEGVSMAPMKAPHKIHGLNTYSMILPRSWLCMVKIDSQPNKDFDKFSIDSDLQSATLYDFTNNKATNAITRLILSSIK